MLDNSKGSKPLYIQIKDIYRNKIFAGEYKLGDRIESENEIQKIFDVSRITARQAVMDLEKEGMVKRHRGKGTFVIWQPGVEVHLGNIMSFTQEMETVGRKPGILFSYASMEKADSEVSQVCNVPVGEPIFCLRRVRTADDVRLAYFVSYIPGWKEDMREKIQMRSLYDMLEESGLGRPVKSKEKIQATLPDEDVIKALKIEKKQPILFNQVISFNEVGELIEYTKCYYRGDLYTYTISEDI